MRVDWQSTFEVCNVNNLDYDQFTDKICSYWIELMNKLYRVLSTR